MLGLSAAFYSLVQIFPNALHSDKQGVGDFMSGLVQTTSEETMPRSSSPLNVDRDSFRPWTWAGFQTGGAWPTLADVIIYFWYTVLSHWFNHTIWVAIITPTDCHKSVRNRCVIEVFGGVFGFFCRCRGFWHRTELDLFLYLFPYIRWLVHEPGYFRHKKLFDNMHILQRSIFVPAQYSRL